MATLPIPKGYIYFAMAFSIFVETINLRVRASKVAAPVKLRQPYLQEGLSDKPIEREKYLMEKKKSKRND